jgi:hypothetical protein
MPPKSHQGSHLEMVPEMGMEWEAEWVSAQETELVRAQCRFRW